MSKNQANTRIFIRFPPKKNHPWHQPKSRLPKKSEGKSRWFCWTPGWCKIRWPWRVWCYVPSGPSKGPCCQCSTWNNLIRRMTRTQGVWRSGWESLLVPSGFFRKGWVRDVGFWQLGILWPEGGGEPKYGWAPRSEKVLFFFGVTDGGYESSTPLWKKNKWGKFGKSMSCKLPGGRSFSWDLTFKPKSMKPRRRGEALRDGEYCQI